ncbi:MAG TPA: PIN domain-containing protein [Anaerolineales bacterium]|nr:PIN domain-containing protein [Anaerolineales bacterium]HLO32785.1 PIN domain-containing protein [Anaerolineales bacterium]
MKIHLDLCAIQRPLDTPDQVRIVLESEAILGIIALCGTEQIELLSSEALLYEGEQSSLPIRREHTFAVLSKAKNIIDVTEKERLRAQKIMTVGIKPLDALHLALAETGNAEYFCTCDDRILRNAKQIKDLRVKVISPIDLVQEIEK